VYPAAWGVTLALCALAAVLHESLPPLRPAAWCLVAALAGLLALNILISAQRLQTLRTAAPLGAALLLGIVVREATPAGGRVVVLALAALGIVAAAHGLYQSFVEFPRLAASPDPEWTEAVRARITSGRAVGSLGLPGALAGLLCMTLPLTAVGLTGLAGRTASGLRRAAIIVLCSLQAVALLATQSAAAFGCAMCAAGLVCWVCRPGGRRRWAIAAALIGAGLIGAAIVLGVRIAAVTAVEGSGPFNLRAGNWLVALRVFADHPGFGVGLGCYGVLFPQYRQWGMNESRFAHNSYLQALAEGGPLLGLLVVAAALIFGRILLRRARRGLEPALIAAAGLSFLLHNLFDFTVYLPSLALVFAAVAGLARDPESPPRSEGAVASRTLVMAAALILAAVALWIARGDAARDAAIEEGRPERLVDAGLSAVEANPIDPESRSILSGALLERSLAGPDGESLAAALRHAERACDLDPFTPHHWHQLGRVRLAMKDPMGAWLALARAAELYPTRIEYREQRDAVARAIADLHQHEAQR